VPSARKPWPRWKRVRSVDAQGHAARGGTTFQTEDTRKDYGEQRIIYFGMLRDRMVVVGYTLGGADRHVFSMSAACGAHRYRPRAGAGESPSMTMLLWTKSKVARQGDT
jgi:uncharacterized DUF497 family protein